MVRQTKKECHQKHKKKKKFLEKKNILWSTERILYLDSPCCTFLSLQCNRLLFSLALTNNQGGFGKHKKRAHTHVEQTKGQLKSQNNLTGIVLRSSREWKSTTTLRLETCEPNDWSLYIRTRICELCVCVLGGLLASQGEVYGPHIDTQAQEPRPPT